MSSEDTRCACPVNCGIIICLCLEMVVWRIYALPLVVKMCVFWDVKSLSCISKELLYC